MPSRRADRIRRLARAPLPGGGPPAEEAARARYRMALTRAVEELRSRGYELDHETLGERMAVTAFVMTYEPPFGEPGLVVYPPNATYARYALHARRVGAMSR